MVFLGPASPRQCTPRPGRRLKVIDATCPLVTKVHQEARKFAAKGYDIVLVGHEGHEEVVGTMGHAPRAVHLVGDEDEAARVEVADPERVAYLTQTTLSVDKRTAGVIGALRGGSRCWPAPFRRHLLRHPEPAGGDQDAGPRLPAGPGHRGHQLLQLGPHGRGRPGRRRPGHLVGGLGRPGLVRGRRHGRGRLGPPPPVAGRRAGR